MKFTDLHIENFLAITEAKLRLDDRGLVAIQGKNSVNTSAQSNGAGKSSIMDALCWCWFGVTARGVGADDVINRGAKKNTRVSSTILDNGIAYTATRHRKHKDGKNTLTLVMNDGLRETDLTKGTDKLTQEVAQKVIGASLDVFTGSIYAGQEKMPDLPSMTDKQLKILIEEAAGITVLEEAYKKAREDANAASVEAKNATSAFDSLDERKTWIEAQLLSAESQMTEWEEGREERVRKIRHDAQINVVKPLISIQENIKNAAEIGDLSAAISTCDQKISDVSQEQSEIMRLEQEVVRVRTGIVSLDTALKQAERAVTAAKSALENVEDQIGKPCGSCGRPMTPNELASAKAAAEQRLSDAEEAVRKAEVLCREERQVLLSAETDRDNFRASMTDLSEISKKRAELLEEKREVEDMHAIKDRLTQLARTYKANIDEAANQPNPHEKTFKNLQLQLSEIKEKVSDAAKEMESALAAHAVEQEVVKLYGPAGVRARVLDEITPYLNGQTAKYLSTLTDGAIDATWSTVTYDSKGKAKERFAIDVSSTEDAGRFEGFSGGEKRKVRIAAALALQDLVATRATKPIELFIADEADDALDDAGLERLMTVLEDKAKERGSVFVISHNEIHDWIRNVVMIEKTTSGTVVKETTG